MTKPFKSAWYWRAVAADARRDAIASRRDPIAMAIEYARWIAARDGIEIPAEAKPGVFPTMSGWWTRAVEFTVWGTVKLNVGGSISPLWVNRAVAVAGVTILIPNSDYNPAATDCSEPLEVAA